MSCVQLMVSIPLARAEFDATVSPAGVPHCTSWPPWPQPHHLYPSNRPRRSCRRLLHRLPPDRRPLRCGPRSWQRRPPDDHDLPAAWTAPDFDTSGSGWTSVVPLPQDIQTCDPDTAAVQDWATADYYGPNQTTWYAFRQPFTVPPADDYFGSILSIGDAGGTLDKVFVSGKLLLDREQSAGLPQPPLNGFVRLAIGSALRPGDNAIAIELVPNGPTSQTNACSAFSFSASIVVHSAPSPTPSPAPTLADPSGNGNQNGSGSGQGTPGAPDPGSQGGNGTVNTPDPGSNSNGQGGATPDPGSNSNGQGGATPALTIAPAVTPAPTIPHATSRRATHSNGDSNKQSSHPTHRPAHHSPRRLAHSTHSVQPSHYHAVRRTTPRPIHHRVASHPIHHMALRLVHRGPRHVLTADRAMCLPPTATDNLASGSPPRYSSLSPALSSVRRSALDAPPASAPRPARGPRPRHPLGPPQPPCPLPCASAVPLATPCPSSSVVGAWTLICQAGCGAP